jgi:hypothetical protein
MTLLKETCLFFIDVGRSGDNKRNSRFTLVKAEPVGNMTALHISRKYKSRVGFISVLCRR